MVEEEGRRRKCNPLSRASVFGPLFAEDNDFISHNVRTERSTYVPGCESLSGVVSAMPPRSAMNNVL